jgi:hypothetical protein
MWIESRWGETATIAGLLVLACIFYFVIIPGQVDSGGGAGLSPRFILDVVTYGVAGACLLRLATLWLRPVSSQEIEYNEHLADREPRHYGRIALIFVGCLVYTSVLIDFLGFYPSSVLMLFCFALLMGERRVLMLLLYPLTITGVLYVLFDVAFQMRMPAGTLARFFDAG